MVRHYHEERIPTVYHWDKIPGVEVRDGVHQKVFRGIENMVGQTTLSPDLEPGPHSHPWEQIAYIAEGACDFHVGEHTVEVSQGDIFVIPPGVKHFADPRSYDDPVVNIDVWPMREDYLSRTSYQTEFQDY